MGWGTRSQRDNACRPYFSGKISSSVFSEYVSLLNEGQEAGVSVHFYFCVYGKLNEGMVLEGTLSPKRPYSESRLPDRPARVPPTVSQLDLEGLPVMGAKCKIKVAVNSEEDAWMMNHV